MLNHRGFGGGLVLSTFYALLCTFVILCGSALGSGTAVLLDRSGSFLRTFAPEVKRQIRAQIGSIRPGDFYWLGVVAGNSLMEPPIVFNFPDTKTTSGMTEFLKARAAFQDRAMFWVDSIYADSAGRTDLFNGICGAVTALKMRKSNASFVKAGSMAVDHAQLIVYSDGNDNVSTDLPCDLDGIDVLLAFVYPDKGDPSDFPAYAKKLEEIFRSKNPRSLRVLFPSEATNLNLRDLMQDGGL